EVEVLEHQLRLAVAETFRERLRGLDFSGFTDKFAEGQTIETGELVTARTLLDQVGTIPGLAKVIEGLGHGDAPTPGQVAAGVELVLEGLYLTQRIGKENVDG